MGGQRKFHVISYRSWMVGSCLVLRRREATWSVDASAAASLATVLLLRQHANPPLLAAFVVIHWDSVVEYYRDYSAEWLAPRENAGSRRRYYKHL